MSSSVPAPEAPVSPPEGARPLRIRFPPELPISARAGDIGEALGRHQVLIVAGATGSGKTTQLPKVALEQGRGVERLIGVTQPRRIAATSVAARVASELECVLGREVGYQIRFEDRTGPDTRLKFMTDGILLAEIQSDPLLRRYDTLIIDEAHERSLTIDFLLGWLARILPKRPDLKVIVSSATIETERFSEFFGNAPVISVEGRTFPVDVLYEPPDPELDLTEATANAVENVTSLDPLGDILVFLPGEREIRETELELGRRNLRHTTVQPLYARLSAADQSKVFAPISGRRIILATNVAETSLTIPGIVYVVDTGVARLSRYEPRTGTTRLQIEGISQASADQRKGRCGRVREGICVRLYDEQSFATRPAFTDPEIKRTGLAAVILRMKSLGLGDVEDFPFLDAPSSQSISEGYRVLEELGALDDERQLTPLGRRLARLPVDPRIGRMIIAGADYDCLPQVLVLSAALEIQDPRERPRGLEQKADQLHQRFRDESSDFAGLLKLWDFVRAAQSRGTGQLKRTCKESFLSFVRVREWLELQRQLAETAREVGLGRERKPRTGKPSEAKPSEAKPNAPKPQDSDALHKALLTGLLSRIGYYDAEQRSYVGARQTRFVIHPSSPLSKKPPAWIMAFELVQTTQLFARTVAKIDPVWLDDVGAHLLKRSYSEPNWSESAARAKIRERATLFGLPVLRDRSVDYDKVAHVRARLMFLEHALVRGEYASRGAFQAKNRELLGEVARLRDKARQSEMLADDEALLAFFDRRVHASVTNGKAFEAWREKAEQKDPDLLVLRLQDVLADDRALEPKDYPDTLVLHGVKLGLSYRFDPSADDDGVTIGVPLALVPQLDPGELDWIIPAWHAEKIAALLETLPKALRRELGVTPQLVERLALELVPFQGSMLPALARAASAATGVEVPVEALRADAIPPHLRLTCRILGERERVIAQSRDVAALLTAHGARARELFQQSAPAVKWERTGLTTWELGELPEFVTRTVLGARVRAYPALVDAKTSVDLKLLEAADVAVDSTRAGVLRLCALGAHKALGSVAKKLPAPFPRADRMPPSRAEVDAFRERVLWRVVQEAFGISDAARSAQSTAELPRTQAAFQALFAAGAPRIEASATRVGRSVQAAAAALEKCWQALSAAASQPSGTHASRDIRAQIDLLLPADLLSRVELERLDQYPRYLRAAETRLARAITDPRKDADKLSPFAPLWRQFLDKRASYRDRDGAEALRWAFEELRVAIFAPELKPAFSVSVASVTRELAALR